MRREYGKLQQVQQQNQALQQRISNLTQWAQSDPDRYRKALIETGGLSEAEAERYVQQKFGNSGGVREEVQPAPTQPVQQPMQPPVNPIDQLAAQEVLAEKRAVMKTRADAIREYIEKNPEADRNSLNLTFQLAGKIERETGVSPAEAIAEAEGRVLGSDEKIKQARKQGELSGLAKASSTASSAMRSPSGRSTQAGETEPDVPDDEWQAAKAAGFKSKKDYVAYSGSRTSSVE
jgi:hypothetical protein